MTGDHDLEPGVGGPPGWAFSAGASGALFALVAACLCGVVLGVGTAVEDLQTLRADPQGQLQGHALDGALLITVSVATIGSAMAVPAGIVLGLVDGSLARDREGSRWLGVGKVVAAVGTAAGLLLPAVVLQAFTLTLFNLLVGVLAGLAAGAHLWREQSKAIRRTACR